MANCVIEEIHTHKTYQTSAKCRILLHKNISTQVGFTDLKVDAKKMDNLGKLWL